MPELFSCGSVVAIAIAHHYFLPLKMDCLVTEVQFGYGVIVWFEMTHSRDIPNATAYAHMQHTDLANFVVKLNVRSRHSNDYVW